MAGEKLRPGQVVTFEHEDRIFGTVIRDVGVVWAVEEGRVVVRPLSSDVLHVAPENVLPITGEDVPAAAQG